MTSASELLEGFQFMNITPTDEVLNKCVLICNKYNVSCDDFVDQWLAYAASNLNGALPTSNELEKMERKIFAKSTKSVTNTPKRAQTTKEPEEIHDSNLTTPKGKRNEINRQLQMQSESPKSIDIAEKYSDRKDSLTVKYSFGVDNVDTSSRQLPLSIKLINDGNELQVDAKYMYEIMGRKASCLDRMTHIIGKAISSKHKIDLSEESLKRYIGHMNVYGRICTDGNSKLNVQSVVLEGPRNTHLGHHVSLNVSKISKSAIFPGQVALMQGNNIGGNKFVVENIFTDASNDLPLEPPVSNESLTMIVASGPFTLNENLLFEPLKDLLQYVVEQNPHVLILMGPFIETNHPSVYNGMLSESFDCLFQSLMESIMVALKDTEIQVVVISSIKEAHHHVVYPTPPYKVREKCQNFTFVSDPCMLNIDGLIIGATTVDTVFHLGEEELVLGPSSDRIFRLASHILQQQCFYPLYPPHEDVCVDHELLEEYGVMACAPHLLILPSTFQHYIKNINETIVINPERLTNGYVAGKFLKVSIKSGNTRSVSSRISCKVIRI